MSNESQELLADFVDEAVASLQGLAVQLESHRQNPEATDSINAVFRAVHSIKGCAGFLGLASVKAFAHTLENTLDDVRKKKFSLTEPLQRDFVQGFDLIEEMLHAALEGTAQAELGPRETELLAHIAELTGESASQGGATEQSLLEMVAELAEEMAAADFPQAREWSDRARAILAEHDTTDADAAAEIAAEGSAAPPSRSVQSIREARFEHRGQDVAPRIDAVTALFVEIQRQPFDNEMGDRFLAAANEFIDWARQAELPTLADGLAKAAADFQKIVNSPLDVDAHLLSIVWDAIWPELEKLEVRPEKATGDAGGPSAGDASSPAAKARMVRIKEERLDEFLDHVSRLFITGELYKDLHSRLSEAQPASGLIDEMRQINGALAAQSTALQQSVVALRRVSIGGLLSKFPRMARGLAGQLGKQIDVHLSGEETEIDKTLAEDLDAPLTHMVRNVVDHAIETPDEREKRGVNPVGNLWLHAEQSRTHVRVVIQDDGRGIDPARLRKKAVEKGFLSQGQVDAMSDAEAIDLIFHAGFSTAEKISDVSGRGVGMDVVRTTLREHGGDVTVESQVNVGTTFRLDIPIRTAVLVIDGLMLSEANQNFVLPFEHIREITEIEPSELTNVQGAHVARIRDNTYAAVRLAEVLDLDRAQCAPGEKLQAVLVGSKHGSLCLLVDRVFGHRQVVVNGIQEILPGKEKIAGVAQLGGGRLALVLSVPDIVKSLCQVG